MPGGAPIGRPRSDPRPLVGSPRDGIVAAATSLFARQGFASTMMREIAEAAGLQPSSIYYWFPSKHAILEEVANTANRASLDQLARIVAVSDSAPVKLHRMVRFDVKVLCDLPYDINEVMRISALQDERTSPYWRERQALNDGVEDLVRSGIDAGELVKVDPRLAALTLLSNDEAVQNWYRLGATHLAGGYEVDQVADFVADLALGYLLRDRDALPEVRRLSLAADRQ